MAAIMHVAGHASPRPPFASSATAVVVRPSVVVTGQLGVARLRESRACSAGLRRPIRRPAKFESRPESPAPVGRALRGLQGAGASRSDRRRALPERVVLLAMSRAAMDLVPRPCFALAEGARLGPGQISGLGRERPSRQECRNGDIPAAAFLSPRVFARLCIRSDPWRGPPRAPVANGG